MKKAFAEWQPRYEGNWKLPASSFTQLIPHPVQLKMVHGGLLAHTRKTQKSPPEQETILMLVFLQQDFVDFLLLLLSPWQRVHQVIMCELRKVHQPTKLSNY